MAAPRIALITGCSSGIGAALAEEFHRRGLRVVATARRVESLAALADKGVRTLALDVDDADSIAAAMAVVERETGRIDLLINNAGFGQFGAVIDMGRDELRRQFDTNVCAPVVLSRAALPLLRRSTSACIVNIGSISGIVTTPFSGVYCASKAALHALSEALRMELAPFGIRVVIVQPGGIASNFGSAGEAHACLPEHSLYKPIERFVLGRARASQRGAMPADAFARAVVDALLRPDPPPVLRLGTHSTRLPFLKRWLPVRLLDRQLAKTFGLDRLTGR
jgi:NAD(P)-dependent dehydrogenase (short-subunit alcohol dehydrogenase family)